MVCIYCGSATQVVNSRAQKRLNQVWRRRQCTSCNNTFTTHEQADLGTSIMVSSDGKLQPFCKEQLLVSIYEACKHRPNAIIDASALTQTVIAQLLPYVKEATLAKELITSITAATLERFDVAAATMYRAYHK